MNHPIPWRKPEQSSSSFGFGAEIFFQLHTKLFKPLYIKRLSCRIDLVTGGANVLRDIAAGRPYPALQPRRESR
jgi:hypothetical protein